MDQHPIKTLDLEFQGVPGVIASYMIPHSQGVILIETGPGSTQTTLATRLDEQGYKLEDVTDVFLTHIHLDHAGAAGWLARHGATIHVHPVGVPHLVDPTKLLASATRIYSDQMDTLWGDFLPIPPDRISAAEDGVAVDFQGFSVLPLETPGHATHHMSYLIQEICFTGDVGGVRLGGSKALRVPMPPPEFHLETWRNTLHRIAALKLKAIAPTHFGIYFDPEWHLATMLKYLDEIEVWMANHLTKEHSSEEKMMAFKTWVKSWDERDNLNSRSKQAFELANPTFMSLDGMQRYWRKYRE